MTTPSVRMLRLYLVVWLALMVLLALTVASSYVKLGAFNVVVSLAISAAKTALVMTLFSRLVGGEANALHEAERARTFLAGRYAEVWNDDAAVRSLTDAVARDLAMGVEVQRASGEIVIGATPMPADTSDTARLRLSANQSVAAAIIGAKKAPAASPTMTP